MLNASGCDTITDDGLAVLGASCYALEELNVSGILKVGDETLRNLGPTLRVLNLFKVGRRWQEAGMHGVGYTVESRWS